jgi:hypothetical protein
VRLPRLLMRQRIIRSHQKRRGGAKDHSTRPSQDSFVLQLHLAAQIIILLDQSKIVLFSVASSQSGMPMMRSSIFLAELLRASEKFLDVSEPLQSSGERPLYYGVNE